MSWPFTSDRRNGHRRGRRNSLSSRLSLSSALTSSSAASNRSDSTVTAGIHASRGSRGKPKGSLEPSKPRTSPSAPNLHIQTDQPADGDLEKVPVDVFQYLDTWDSRAASQLSLVEPIPENRAEAASPAPEVAPELQEHQEPKEGIQQIGRMDHTPGSFHSDSGISMQDSSDQQSPLATKAASLDFDRVAGNEKPQDTDQTPQVVSPVSIQEAPESFYRNDDNVLGPKPWRPWETTQTRALRPHAPSEPEPSVGEKSPINSPPEPLSPTLPLPPPPASLYRTFHKLNHTVLGAWQDDLVHLESVLTQLDANGRFPPLEHHRREVLEQIERKLAQYNRLLCSARDVQRSFRPASAAELAALRARLLEATDKQQPQQQQPVVSYSITDQYLLSHEHPDDLISLAAAAPSPFRFPSTGVLAALLLPLLAISLARSYVARLALLLVTAALLVAGWRSLDVRAGAGMLGIGDREGKICVLGYVGVMVGLAVLF